MKHTLKIGFVGDVMLGELVENYRRGVRSMIERKDIDPFVLCRGELMENDLNVANLECLLTDKSNRKGFFRDILRAPSEFVTLLAKAPFHVVSIANNHALDHGRDALSDCVLRLSSAGIQVVGFEAGSLLQRNPVVVSVRGFKIGFWSFNLANVKSVEMSDRMKFILNRVETSTGKFDRVCVLMHWGEEYTSLPPEEVYRMGCELAMLGVDVVCGHHSHRLQGVASIAGTVFAPSLGNFIFDDRRPDSTLTSILRVEFRPSKEPRWEALPHTINQFFQPTPDSDRSSEIRELDQRLAQLMDEVDHGGSLIREKIARDVARGHRHNRLRMRALMVRHFINYRGGYGDLLSYIVGRNRVPFSVTDCDEWNDRLR